MERVYTAAPTFGIPGSTGGIPDYFVDKAEYSGWQNEQMRKAKEDLHPDNAGKTRVTSESWAPKERVAAVREGRGN
jgi:hypothetical protein